VAILYKSMRVWPVLKKAGGLDHFGNKQVTLAIFDKKQVGGLGHFR
jgi:hypothetical protein